MLALWVALAGLLADPALPRRTRLGLALLAAAPLGLRSTYRIALTRWIDEGPATARPARHPTDSY
jgi:hypothetical protein